MIGGIVVKARNVRRRFGFAKLLLTDLNIGLETAKQAPPIGAPY